MLIVGSKALKFHYPDFPRKVMDIDIIGFSHNVESLIDLLSPAIIKRNDYSVLLKEIQNKTDIFDTDNVEVFLADNSV